MTTVKWQWQCESQHLNKSDLNSARSVLSVRSLGVKNTTKKSRSFLSDLCLLLSTRVSTKKKKQPPTKCRSYYGSSNGFLLRQVMPGSCIEFAVPLF